MLFNRFSLLINVFLFFKSLRAYTFKSFSFTIFIFVCILSLCFEQFIFITVRDRINIIILKLKANQSFNPTISDFITQKTLQRNDEIISEIIFLMWIQRRWLKLYNWTRYGIGIIRKELCTHNTDIRCHTLI